MLYITVNQKTYDIINGTADRKGEKNSIQDSPHTDNKIMPFIPSKDVRKEGERESKNNGSVEGFES